MTKVLFVTIWQSWTAIVYSSDIKLFGSSNHGEYFIPVDILL